MPDYHCGDIVLLDYPFSDRRATKRRPAVILDQDSDRDLLILRVTSKPYAGPTVVELDDWLDAGLLSPSRVRLTKLFSVGEFDVIRPLGKLTPNDRGRVLSALRRYVASLGLAE